MEFWLPYGQTDVAVAVPDENLLGFLAPVGDSSIHDPAEVVRAALHHQTARGTLLEVAKRARNTVIAYSGKSAAPSSIANLLAQGLVQNGAQNIHLLAGSFDSMPLGSDHARTDSNSQPRASATKHDPKGSPVVKVGQLDDGSEVLLNETFASADLKCVVTDVTVNPFWGYSGGPSSLVPGLASEKTVKTCLSPALKAEKLPGVLTGNPTYETLVRASQSVQVDFAVHVVASPDGNIAGAFAGDFLETYQQACSLSTRLFRPSLRRKADIVISSAGGTPWDRTLFDACTSAILAASICKDQGIIIVIAECPDGLGRFPSGGLQTLDPKGRLAHARRAFSLEMLLEYSFRKISGEHRTYLVSTLPERQASLYELLDAKSVRSALERAIRHAGKEATVALVPYGSHTAPLIGEGAPAELGAIY